MLIYVNTNKEKLTRREVGKVKVRFSALKGTIFLVFFSFLFSFLSIRHRTQVVTFSLKGIKVTDKKMEAGF